MQRAASGTSPCGLWHCQVPYHCWAWICQGHLQGIPGGGGGAQGPQVRRDLRCAGTSGAQGPQVRREAVRRDLRCVKGPQVRRCAGTSGAQGPQVRREAVRRDLRCVKDWGGEGVDAPKVFPMCAFGVCACGWEIGCACRNAKVVQECPRRSDGVCAPYLHRACINTHQHASTSGSL